MILIKISEVRTLFHPAWGWLTDWDTLTRLFGQRFPAPRIRSGKGILEKNPAQTMKLLSHRDGVLPEADLRIFVSSTPI